MVKHKNLTRPKFRAWLSEHSSGEFVGVRKDTLLCPIANFMNSQTGVQSASVGTAYMYLYMERTQGTVAYDMPQWADYFIEDVDNSGQAYSRITARTALKMIKGG